MVNREQRKFVAYYRVSTAKQGRSGLGLEAQQAAVESHLRVTGGDLLAEFVEVESGKRDDRPQLAEAMHRCKVTGSRLLIAKLDRLSRNAAFLLQLRDSGVGFVCCDMPDATELTVGIMAVIAEEERRKIADRTREALAAAKARGVKLGNPNGAAAIRHLGNASAVEQIKADAQERATDLAPVVADIQSHGITTMRGIAAELNSRGIVTPRGGRWHPTSVQRLLQRL